MAAIGKGSHTGLARGKTRAGSYLEARERLVEIGLEILDILKPDGEADAAVENAELGALPPASAADAWWSQGA